MLTPRRLLISLCAALGGLGLLWLAAPALSLGPVAPKAVDFELRVPAATGGATARAASARRWTSPVLRAPKRFDLLGLRWRGDAEHVDAEVRVRRAGGRWSAWTEAHDAEDEGPDGGSTPGSNPVWTGGSDELQLRMRRRPAGLKVHFVNATGTATPGARRMATVRAAMTSVVRWATALPAAGAAGEQPSIVPRAEWDPANQCAPRRGPSLGQVQMAFVHHTADTAPSTPEQSRARVLAICRFHRDGNGWDDIGYNFLVDQWGTIFEGRAGGIDQPIAGAQAQGYNAVSTGIANLGTFETVAQSEAAIAATSRLIAWKLPLHGAPVTGPVTVASGGGSSNRYPSGTPVTFDRISGHRDANNTSCPGSTLYAQLPRLRQLAAARAPGTVPAPTGPPAALSLTAATRRLAYPAPARLSGRMTDASGRGVAAAPVGVQLLTAKGFRTWMRTTTGADGRWAVDLQTARNRAIRAVRDTPDGPRPISATVPVTVAPALTSTVPENVAVGRRTVVTGSISPRKAAVVVSANRRTATGGIGPRVARLRVRVVNGRYRGVLALRTPGIYRIRVAYAGDTTSAPSLAPDAFVRIARAGTATGPGATPAAPGALAAP